jgi:hypothetical protein
MLHFGEAREEIWENVPGVIHRARDSGVKVVWLSFGANIEIEAAALDGFVEFRPEFELR